MYSAGPGDDAVKLAGGPAGTATFAYAGPDGGLIVELYDHSPDAQSWFGNDVAFLLHVAPADLDRLGARLGQSADERRADAALLSGLRDRFADYHAVRRWLDEQGVPYRTEFDSHA